MSVPKNANTSGDGLAEGGTNEAPRAEAEIQGLTTRRKELVEVTADSLFGNGPTSVMASVHTAEIADAGGAFDITKFMSESVVPDAPADGPTIGSPLAEIYATSYVGKGIRADPSN